MTFDDVVVVVFYVNQTDETVLGFVGESLGVDVEVGLWLFDELRRSLKMRKSISS